MRELEERIIKDGSINPGNVLKVDSFLNHQIDIRFLETLGEEFKRRFDGKNITKILTIEASGIGVASITSKYFDYPPVVFAKKSKTSNISNDVYKSSVHSYTHNETNHIIVSKQYLHKDDYVLIIDDFLANGCAVLGLIDLIKQAGAHVAGIGIVIEKGYQEGGQLIREQGYHLESLAIIKSMDGDTGKIQFVNNDE